jgi:magnesium transporter
MIDRRLDFGAAHWRDFSGVSKEELEKLAAEYGLARDMVIDCLDPTHLPKISRTPKVTFLMLRAYDEESPEDGTTVQELTRKVALFMGENFLLTFHRMPLKWLDAVWDNWDHSPKRDAAVLSPVIEDIVEECLYTFEEPIDHAGLAVDKLEDNIFHNGQAPVAAREIVEDAYLAKKRATLFKRLLRLTRDIVPSISKIGDPTSAVIQNLKEEADRLYFYSDDLVETANDLVQLSISLASNRTNEVVRVLTLVSIFLLPLNLLTGIYGMNFVHMPELHWKYGYLMVLTVMFLVEVGVFYVLKKKGWIRTKKYRVDV